MNIAPHGSSIAAQPNPARRALRRRLLHMLILICALVGLPLRAEATTRAASVQAPLLRVHAALTSGADTAILSTHYDQEDYHDHR
jgi:hypothetical protein